ncbi:MULTISPECIES: gamma carbonic anhydrase family protein [Prauserella salsuginis group]|uniref:Gamma carbonic anhydrase family protein n=1 Tax=Prauserella salsuginis TaxID=387889 RepID=A0ABW6GBL5_9PSEU|nr:MULTISPECIES: gamma carbonic anhydrase family protein [Prauserella salsuginis group]MCR3721904.1 Carbonic anhydrase or acetyltransferase, isoleucine patch superfamily [Prauserella flava]MCR3735909.1 Carbonic anhydrase or acetyltransferase, isoleucine patch superfamily [Prauserella salsuginis]
MEINGTRPTIDPSAWVAPDAVVVGAVTMRAESSAWYTAVLRADFDAIAVGEGSNVQDGTIVHADPGYPVTIGNGVSVGHRAVLHGCTVEDDCLIGMGAVVLNGAVIGRGSLIAAGAVVPHGTEIPSRSLVAGVPAKVRRELTDDERAANLRNASDYRALQQQHAQACTSAG